MIWRDFWPFLNADLFLNHWYHLDTPLFSLDHIFFKGFKSRDWDGHRRTWLLFFCLESLSCWTIYIRPSLTFLYMRVCICVALWTHLHVKCICMSVCTTACASVKVSCVSVLCVCVWVPAEWSQYSDCMLCPGLLDSLSLSQGILQEAGRWPQSGPDWLASALETAILFQQRKLRSFGGGFGGDGFKFMG